MEQNTKRNLSNKNTSEAPRLSEYIQKNHFQRGVKNES